MEIDALESASFSVRRQTIKIIDSSSHDELIISDIFIRLLEKRIATVT